MFFFQNSNNKLIVIAGPCAIENEKTPLLVAEHLLEITKNIDISVIFKGSYRKANRSRLDSFSGIGDEKALRILKQVKKETGLPILTDIHNWQEVSMVSEYVDILQIPAFLVRQTDLVVAAAQSQKAINLKKGQFLSPESMEFPVQKAIESGAQDIAITERGSCFGYQDLVVDFRGIPKMRRLSPVILDVTHSLQKPNQTSGITGGTPEMIETITKCGIAAGCNGLFIETHPEPNLAKSDGANMLKLSKLRSLLEKSYELYQLTQKL